MTTQTIQTIQTIRETETLNHFKTSIEMLDTAPNPDAKQELIQVIRGLMTMILEDFKTEIITMEMIIWEYYATKYNFDKYEINRGEMTNFEMAKYDFSITIGH